MPNARTNRGRGFIFALILLIALLLSGSRSPANAQTVTPTPTPRPTITPIPTQVQSVNLTLWHSWLGLDAQLLDTWIADFEASHPGVQISAKYIGGDLRTQFTPGAQSDQKPDIFIGASTWVGGLADAQLIVPAQRPDR